MSLCTYALVVLTKIEKNIKNIDLIIQILVKNFNFIEIQMKMLGIFKNKLHAHHMVSFFDRYKYFIVLGWGTIFAFCLWNGF